MAACSLLHFASPLLLFFLILSGCTQALDNGSLVILTIGETVVVNNTDITLKSIIEDSRCPTDVQCFWEGRVIAEIELAQSGNKETLLVASNQGKQKAMQFPLSLSLEAVQPAPVAGEQIPVAEYTLTLRVESA